MLLYRPALYLYRYLLEYSKATAAIVPAVCGGRDRVSATMLSRPVMCWQTINIQIDSDSLSSFNNTLFNYCSAPGLLLTAPRGDVSW